MVPNSGGSGHLGQAQAVQQAFPGPLPFDFVGTSPAWGERAGLCNPARYRSVPLLLFSLGMLSGQ